MPKYLPTEQAVSRLSLDKIAVDTSYELDSIISQIEQIVDAELEQSFGLEECIDISQPNYAGVIKLENSPVKTVLTVERIVFKQLKQTPEAIAARKNGEETGNDYVTENFTWNESNQIKVPSRWSKYRIAYLAGYPVPDVVINAVYDILKLHLINKESSLNWLHEPTKDKTSLSLPGGISGTAKLSETGHKTQLERLLATVKKTYGKNGFYF
ncbi:hypothetical protein [Crocosphaera sp.]|uniref:hypothetical protein n=1 Tax=Crocosphaera sp. TaxID=2729996 RepID=UPI002620587C|nr:hypothetical protein [Crocosphaera sp.]MDJ0582912.1 hypothetical protein [Crocosphaera sp.]